MADRVIAYIDGFNLYHAVNDLRAEHLKWLNVRALMQAFVDPTAQQLVEVKYFSAYATWLQSSYLRHQAYVAALEAVGVTALMGHFKERTRRCPECRRKFVYHEEKETDVNIGIHMVRDGHRNAFDRALLVSNDSDLSPVVRSVRADFPDKIIRILTPPERRTSKELASAAGNFKHVKSIQRIHVERALLPAEIAHPSGRTIRRPLEYAPSISHPK